MEILLTNDDGIDATGLRALYDALSRLGEVTAVAPADDQSAVGRQLSNRVELADHELGWAVEGTPADCILAGLGALGLEPDIVVAGCNRGANLGEYVLGRSGTVSAAVEATFFGVPAVASSLYFPGSDVTYESFDPVTEAFREAVRATTYLVERAPAAGVFEHADYLNVNAPLPDGEPAAMEITRPSTSYAMDAEREEDGVAIYDRIWDRMAEGDIADPAGTDRRAVMEGRVSVSPLTAPHTSLEHDALDALVADYLEGG